MADYTEEQVQDLDNDVATVKVAVQARDLKGANANSRNPTDGNFEPYRSSCSRLIMMVGIAIGMTMSQAHADEVWPTPVIPQKPSILGFGAWTKDQVIPVYFTGLFFQHRADLDRYIDSEKASKAVRKAVIGELVKAGRLVKFDQGRQVIALDDFVDGRGRVRDKEYGDGYMVINADDIMLYHEFLSSNQH